MHELSLYGSVPAERHGSVLQQLAGVTCMQPQPVEELHLIFKSRIPPGLEKVQGSGGTQSAQLQQEFQKVKQMLQLGIYYVQLVGTVLSNSTSEHTRSDGHDVDMADTSFEAGQNVEKVQWQFEYKDTPEVSKQPVNIRLVSRTNIEDGEMVAFMQLLGFDYVSRYRVEGHRFYNQDTTLFLQRLRQLPQVHDPQEAVDVSELLPKDDLLLLDGSGSYTLQASIDIVDGNVQELRDRAIQQLTAIRDELKSAVDIAPADRLALDTRISIPARRI